MNKLIKRQFLKLALILIPLVGFIVFVLVGLSERQKELKENPVFCKGFIIDIYVGTKARDFVKYEFMVNDKRFIGHQEYYPKIDKVEIGDSCQIVYAKTNPDINEILTNSDKTLKTKSNKIKKPLPYPFN